MKIELAGRTVGYEDTGGPGIPLVLIHGFPLDRSLWTAQVRGLADVARVIAPDLRGFGESAMAAHRDPAAAMTMDGYAGDVAGLLDALDISSAVVGGVSMGGYVAMAFQREFPGRVRGLVLVDTRGGPDSPEARNGRNEMIAAALARGGPAVTALMLGRLLLPGNVGSPMGRALSDLMGAQSAVGLVAALGAIRDRPDSRASLESVRVPTLVVCGAEDALIPPAESVALRDAIPGAHLEIVPAAGHLPPYEQADAFNRIVRGFLARVP